MSAGNEGKVMNNVMPQKWRFMLLAVDIAVLCLASYVIFGQVVPPNGDKGFWFYVALLGVVLGSRLDTPFFVKPADVVLYAAPAAIALALGNHWSVWQSGEKVAFVLATGYAVLVAAIAATAILTLGSRSSLMQKISSVSKALSEVLGTPRAIFTVVVLFALYAYHRDSALELGVIGVSWAFTVVISPVETLIRLARKVALIITGGRPAESVAVVAAYQTPGLVLVRTSSGSSVGVGDLVVVNDPLGAFRICTALDYVGRDDGLLLRLVELPPVTIPASLKKRLSSLQPNQASVVAKEELGAGDSYESGAIVGIVAPETTLERLYFEVADDADVEEGRLVEVQVANRFTTYQIVNGLTREEIVQSKNTFGFSRAQAQRIGEWDEETKRFRASKWLPRPNAPIFLKRFGAFTPQPDAVGHFPGTSYPASIKSIDELVTHNTAVLGILGVGKSMLSIELVERMIAAGIKVVCLDLTNQYAVELSDYYDSEYELACLQRIQAAGLHDLEAWAENPEEGGSLPSLKEAFKADLEDFLRDDQHRMLKIYNPAQVVGSKQTAEARSFQAGGQWRRGAALWGVTPVEVTRIVSETALALLQDRMSTKARLCLVYEEAHSLVPEFSSVATPSDREATNGTARAILQGRKYGLGCLLITQRTANVTKTILNQCNTVFAMRTFDETGKEFLANYVGRDYAAMLSSIPERHAVFFGKASSCENPVLIRLNDRDAFRHVFAPSMRTLEHQN